ncbi:hypothetical protein [Erwinia sp. CGal63]|uniref:hypothetical protein n=1 Tax=Erwinia sp. CGal63 TaxID=2919889 RepID=UPI00300BC505
MPESSSVKLLLALFLFSSTKNYSDEAEEDILWLALPVSPGRGMAGLRALRPVIL